MKITEPLTVLPHPHFVSDVQFVAQRKELLLTGCWDGCARVWESEHSTVSQLLAHLCPGPVFLGQSPSVLEQYAKPADTDLGRIGLLTASTEGLRVWPDTPTPTSTSTSTSASNADPNLIRAGPFWGLTAVSIEAVACGPHSVYDPKRKRELQGTVETPITGPTPPTTSPVATRAVISPDGSLVCTCEGGHARLWDFFEAKPLYSTQLKDGTPLLAGVYSPTRYWLTLASEAGLWIVDLESKTVIWELMLTPNYQEAPPAHCHSLVWSTDGTLLFAGYTDGLIRVFRLGEVKAVPAPAPLPQVEANWEGDWEAAQEWV